MSESIAQYAEAKKAAEDARAALEARLEELVQEAGEIRTLLGRRRPRKVAKVATSRMRKTKTADVAEAGV